MRGLHLQRPPLLLEEALREHDDERVARLKLAYQVVRDGVQPVRVPGTVDVKKAEVEILLLEGPRKENIVCVLETLRIFYLEIC